MIHMPTDADIRSETRDYLFERGEFYIQDLVTIKERLRNYQQTKGQQGIYRVASRSDYQDGELKHEREVFEKVKRKLTSGAATTLEALNSITDYVGLRVICVYPSDIPPLGRFIGDSLRVREAQWNIPVD